MNKKTAVTLALTSLIALFAGTVRADVSIDLTTASIGLAPQSSINISNISYGGAKYDATLQWNPVKANFDIASVVVSSASVKKCSLGILNILGYHNPAWSFNVTLTSDSSARTITIAYTPTLDYSSGVYIGFTNNSISDLFDFSIIQNQAQLYTTTDSSKLSTNTALYSQSPDPITAAAVDWGKVSAGSTRYATITKIPTWFNFSLPIASVFDANLTKTYTCL
jgi:hypothetical protein